MDKEIKEGYSPFNLNKENPLEDIDTNTICYFDTETTGLLPSAAQRLKWFRKAASQSLTSEEQF